MESKSHLDSSWRPYMAILALPLWHADFMYFSKISRTPPNLKTSKSGGYLRTDLGPTARYKRLPEAVDLTGKQTCRPLQTI